MSWSSDPPRPGPYVPPAAYGSGDGGDAPDRPLLPWLLVGGAVLLGGVGVLLVVLLRSRDDGDAAAAGPSTSSAPGGPSSPSTLTPDGGTYEHSERVARAWVEAMRSGDYRTAFDLSCAQVQVAATAGAPGGDAAEQLGATFVDRILDGGSFTAATLEEIDFDEISRTDVVTFSLTAEDGRTVPLDVFVISEGTVCDFL